MKWNVQHDHERPDRVFVMLDNRFDVALIRTREGLTLEVSPVTDDEVWDDPVERFEVGEEEMTNMEREIEDDAA